MSSVRYYVKRKPIDLDSLINPDTNKKPTDIFADTVTVMQRLCACPFCHARWWADAGTETVHRCRVTGCSDYFEVPE